MLTEDDCLVTVCDNAHEDLAPTVLAAPRRRLHWSVADPVPAGTKQAFEDAYVDLEGRVIALARHLTDTTARAQRDPTNSWSSPMSDSSARAGVILDQQAR
jgi:hypothetical protein